MQQTLFHSNENILPFSGEAFFYPSFFSKKQSDGFLELLKNEISWKQEPIKMFGKEVIQPSLTA
jgi:hypothetical protein